MGTDLNDLTEKQRDIVTEARKNSNKSNEEIAVETDASASYVSQVRNEHSDLIENDSGSLLPVLVILVVLGLAYAAENGLL
ncbi:hypothetical protein [Natrinema sp. SYSU A 869]|uniref:hypothetical protein n=1 Tax=Natrinema sp. SYSU A 869 TaxID=2871694 RepID=UPI001CA3AC5C|nr:hypothetical protein [Natrinema sp. SYSU A 869]